MIDLFANAYANPEAEVERALVEGRRPIRTLGYDAPFSLLNVLGFQPIRLVAPRLAATPRADAIMGAAEMGPRGRALLEAMLDPLHPDVPVLITQTDYEQPQIFAALRELGRLGENVPRHVHFYDRLHMDRASSRDYTEQRTQQLLAWLEAVAGAHDKHRHAELASASIPQQNPPSGLQAQFAGKALESIAKVCEEKWTLKQVQGDEIGIGLAQLAHLRNQAKISGTDALQVIGAAAILPFAEYATALNTLLTELSNAASLPGHRVFLTGSAHEGAEMYAAIEAEGALIVCEAHGWGNLFGKDAPPPRVTDSSTLAAQVRAAAGGARLIHISLSGDEAAPWEVARLGDCLALRSGAIPDAAFSAKVRAFLTGQAEPAAAPMAQPARAAKSATAPSRSRKVLTSVADVNAWQREWFASVRQQVAAGSPFAVVNANAPQEILRALDIPFVVNQWWASIVAAKQQSRRYLGLLKERHYPTDVDAYSAQGIAAAFDDDAENAPWGGLPKPTFLHAVASTDAALKMFSLWAEETGAAPYLYERSIDPRPDLFSDWWARLPEHWDTALESERLDLMVAELRQVISSLETATGRTFTAERFAEVMHLVNEQELYYRQTRDLIARTIPAPIGVVDSMPATMVPQWHRGSEWARDAAKAFYEEVKARVDAGLAAVPNERVRLMFVGRGLWSEMGFYQKWEESHGAVFVWSMYLALAADGYVRDFSGGRDPLRALASRMIVMGDELRMPTWAGPWYVHEAQTHAIDAVVALSDADPFVVRALRAAGFPVLELTMENFNREADDAASIDAQVSAFIEGAASERARIRHDRT